MLPCDLDAHMEVIKQVTKADLGGYALPIYEGAGSVWGEVKGVQEGLAPLETSKLLFACKTLRTASRPFP